MKLLAIEAAQLGHYYVSRYHQVEANGAELYVLCGEGTSDHWRSEHLRLLGDKSLSALIDAARVWHEREKFDGVFTFAEMSVIATAAIAEALALPGIGLQAARNSRNKLLMRQAHEQGGAPIPKFRLVHNIQDALASADLFGYPVVLKPTMGAASAFVFRIDNPEDLQRRFPEAEQGIRTMDSFKLEADDSGVGPNGLLIESFLDGREFLIEAFIWDDEVYLGSVVDRVTVEGTTFDDDIHHAPTDLSSEALVAVHRAVMLGARAQGLLRSVMHAEVRFHAGQPHLLEIAARPGGGGLDYMARISAGYCPIRAVMRIACGAPPALRQFQATPVHTAAMVLLSPRGVIRAINVPESLPDDPSIFFFKLVAKPGDVIKRPPEGNSIIGFLGARGSSFDEAMQAATRASERIDIQVD